MRSTSAPSLPPEGKLAFATQNVNRISLPIPRLRHQKLELGVGELEHEIGGEFSEVAAHLLVQPAGLDAIERGEVGIEQDFAAAYEEDAALDALDRDDRTLTLAYAAPVRQVVPLV